MMHQLYNKDWLADSYVAAVFGVDTVSAHIDGTALV